MLGIAVFVASFATMAFELAGARALAPYLGTTIEVWSGVIASILGGLALGYWLGGVIADRHPKKELLATWLWCAGTAVAVTALLHDIVPQLAAQSGIALSPTALLTGIILFVPASFCLGAVSPTAARLALRNLEGSAKAVGNLSAWAAVGSIVGTVATGTIFIGYFGTSMLLAATALLLVAVSFVIEWRTLWWLRVLVASGTAFVAWHGVAYGFVGQLADIDSAYRRIRVVQIGSERNIITDPYGYQCGAKVEEDGTVSTEPVFGYTRFFDIGRQLRPDTARTLVIGGCNLSYPRHLLDLFPRTTVDTVEIDPAMTQVARDWFGYRDDPRLSVHHEDARRFLNDASGQYDLVFGDAFDAAGSIPYQLSTREAMGRIASLLGDRGIYVMNTFGAVHGPASVFTDAELATMRQVFPHVKVFAFAAVPESVQNLMIVASQAPIEIRESDPLLGKLEMHEVPLSDFGTGMVLTDDYAPVETLTAATRSEVTRR